MELYMACVLIALGLGLLIYKGLLLALFMSYPLPGQSRDLKWKRSPSLPMQELGRRFAAKSSDKIRRGRSSGSGHRVGSSSPGQHHSRMTREKQPLAQHQEIPLETVTLSIEDPVVVGRPSSRGYGRDNFGTVV